MATTAAPKDFCEGCTCGRAEGGGLAAPEAYEAAARDARSFTAPMDLGDSEGIEPAVPLRSKMWFNNPEDGMSGSPRSFVYSEMRELIRNRHGRMLCREIPQQWSYLYVAPAFRRDRSDVRLMSVCSGGNHKQEETNHRYRPNRIRSSSMQFPSRSISQEGARWYHRERWYSIRIPLSSDPGNLKEANCYVGSKPVIPQFSRGSVWVPIGWCCSPNRM